MISVNYEIKIILTRLHSDALFALSLVSSDLVMHQYFSEAFFKIYACEYLLFSHPLFTAKDIFCKDLPLHHTNSNLVI